MVARSADSRSLFFFQKLQIFRLTLHARPGIITTRIPSYSRIVISFPYVEETMVKLSTLLGFGILGVALLVSTGTSGDKKDPAKIKGQIPAGWKNLSLSKEQTTKIQGIDAKFKAKIRDLEDQIKDLKVQERSEMVKLLTVDQKDLLRKLAVGEDEPKEKKDKASKDKSDDK